MNMWTDQAPMPLTMVSMEKRDLSSMATMAASERMPEWYLRRVVEVLPSAEIRSGGAVRRMLRTRQWKGGWNRSKIGGSWTSITGARSGSAARRCRIAAATSPSAERGRAAARSAALADDDEELGSPSDSPETLRIFLGRKGIFAVGAAEEAGVGSEGSLREGDGGLGAEEEGWGVGFGLGLGFCSPWGREGKGDEEVEVGVGLGWGWEEEEGGCGGTEEDDDGARGAHGDFRPRHGARPLDPDAPLKPGKLYFLVDLPRADLEPDHRREGATGAGAGAARSRAELCRALL
ncbi:hypothetical protein ACMD2_15620, partial [Ananas comosus]